VGRNIYRAVLFRSGFFPFEFLKSMFSKYSMERTPGRQHSEIVVVSMVVDFSQ
jgi:hypothetical protein